MSKQSIETDAAILEVTVRVNEQPVTINGPRITGAKIKSTAIDQGVCIQADFILSEELPGHRTRIVGDDDVITVNKNSQFIAVAPDDNS